MITIRHSLPKDLDAIIEIFHYARQFMKEHGNPNQWINGYPSAELILREITVYPLVGVAMLFHELTGIVEYFYNCIQIFGQ